MRRGQIKGSTGSLDALVATLLTDKRQAVVAIHQLVVATDGYSMFTMAQVGRSLSRLRSTEAAVYHRRRWVWASGRLGWYSLEAGWTNGGGEPLRAP